VRLIVASVFFGLMVSSAFGNPFTGGAPDGSAEGEQRLPVPASVRVSQPDETLVNRQMELRNDLAFMFQQWKDGSNPAALWLIIAIAFIYGVLHALGPGHRKTVVFSIYLARKSSVTEPGITGLLLALLHGGSAILVIFVLKGVTGAISARADILALWMEGVSYLFLIIMALILAIRALYELFAAPKHKHRRAVGLGAVLVSGVYPCPGAVLILILSLTLNMTLIGIIAVLSMSVGMSIPIIAAGYLAWFGRTGLFLGLKSNEAMLYRLSTGAELTGYLVLLGFSVYMAQPFLLSLIRMYRGV